MKEKEFVSLAKRLLPHLPSGFVVKGPMTFICPVEHTLRGICFEGSRFDARAFYVWVFFMPLCVPAECVHFTFGRRLKRDESDDEWDANMPNLEATLISAIQEVVPFLVGLRTMKDVAEALRPLTKRGNPHCHEAFACSLARAGETNAAIAALDDLLGFLKPTTAWEREIGSRTRLLRNKLANDPETAQSILAEWQAVSIRNLALDDYCKGELRGNNGGASRGQP
jgi:hypothetical protein